MSSKVETQPPPLHRLVDDAQRAPADVFMTLVLGFTFARVRDHAREKLLRVAGKLSRRVPVLEQVEQGSTLEPAQPTNPSSWRNDR